MYGLFGSRNIKPYNIDTSNLINKLSYFSSPFRGWGLVGGYKLREGDLARPYSWRTMG